MYLYLFLWRHKIIYILDGLRVTKFVCVNYSFNKWVTTYSVQSCFISLILAPSKTPEWGLNYYQYSLFPIGCGWCCCFFFSLWLNSGQGIEDWVSGLCVYALKHGLDWCRQWQWQIYSGWRGSVGLKLTQVASQTRSKWTPLMHAHKHTHRHALKHSMLCLCCVCTFDRHLGKSNWIELR